jgi:hypothetical protein
MPIASPIVTLLRATAHLQSPNGSRVVIRGGVDAFDAVCKALEAAGAVWDEEARVSRCRIRRARCPDALLCLMHTCTKLGIAFWDYLADRLGTTGHAGVPPLPISSAAGDIQPDPVARGLPRLPSLPSSH